MEANDLQTRIDNISHVIATHRIPVDELCRSPSPEPRYDTRGKRVNTRADRARDKLELERHKLCSRLKVIRPDFRPPPNMRPLKVADKLYIPKEKEGTINFIGLILGPRGTTQKALEKEFACRVAIRGKGSVKDGRRTGPVAPDDDDKLHVVISAEGFDAHDRIERCKTKIKDIITPRADDENEHKQDQLRYLAEINGTLRDQDIHRVHGPSAASAANSGGIHSGHCGVASHPSSDCQNKAGDGPALVTPEIDAEYQSLMAELDDGDGAPTALMTTAVGGLPPGKEDPVLAGRGNASALDGPGRTRPTPPWLLPGSFAKRPAPPPPPPPPPPGQLGPHGIPGPPTMHGGGMPSFPSGRHPFPPPPSGGFSQPGYGQGQLPPPPSMTYGQAAPPGPPPPPASDEQLVGLATTPVSRGQVAKPFPAPTPPPPPSDEYDLPPPPPPPLED